MSPKYRPRFKAEAEETAEEVRAELSLRNIDPLTASRLAQHLDVPIIALAALPARASGLIHGVREAVNLLQDANSSALSALTVFDGPRRLVLHNDKHEHGRQASDLMHELAHGLLLHPPTPAFDGGGCRAWNTEIEDEATYMAGALLVPGKAARWSAKKGLDDSQVAVRFGCSVEMATWRLNVTGARRLMSRT